MNIEDTEPGLWRFLKRAGYSDRQIAGMTLETRMLHDLRLRGDNFLDTLEILVTEFDVDMSAFDWSRYTPSEGELLFPWLPISWLLGKYPRHENYEPLTLGMIAVALNEKRWQSH